MRAGRRRADHSTDDTSAVVLTMIACDEGNEVVTVVWRQDYGTTDHPNSNQPSSGRMGSGRMGTAWRLTIDGAVPHQGTGGVRPSPPILADIIRRAVTTCPGNRTTPPTRRSLAPPRRHRQRDRPTSVPKFS